MPENIEQEITWAQAKNGQLASFGTGDEYHAAAPQFSAGFKILISNESPYPVLSKHVSDSEIGRGGI